MQTHAVRDGGPFEWLTSASHFKSRCWRIAHHPSSRPRDRVVTRRFDMTGGAPITPRHHSDQHGSQAIPWERAGQDDFYPPLLIWAEAASRKNRSRSIWLSRVELLSLIAVAASVTTFVLAERYLWE